MDTPETNVDRLLQARVAIDERLRQHKVNLAVFFTDVVASTEYFDRYGDTAGLAMVDRHAQLGTRTVEEFGGRVIKTIGDSVMAEFTDATTCVRAAIELQRRLFSMNAKLPERDRLQLRIGINFGSCFRQRKDIFGDAVNLAARITKRTGPAQILISDSVFHAIQHEPQFHCTPLGAINFKGKQETENVFEVVWTDPSEYTTLRRETTQALARGALRAPGVHVGQLLQQLDDLTRATTATRGFSPTNETEESPARFVAGTMIAERYRIIANIGKGGMGEVFRAEDLKLKQEVALKFLPQEFRDDGASLARLHQEVKIARQVSHRNVCRVFDVGDSAGVPFVTMEYVDGEDLKTLLHRIGHFPQERAIDVSRQICNGLSAIHELGVLHRDLKPANIMLDSKGRVRIMDFGLATLAQSAATVDARDGTPAYMAPEQVSGGLLSPQTDIYSLGLVLYEVFTGQRAFEEASRAPSSSDGGQQLPKNPSSLVSGLDPLADKAIFHCLQVDPSKRPDTAIQVASELPGRDLVRAAIEAGETPSPAMIAASGSTEGLRPYVAWSLLASFGIFFATAIFLYNPMRFFNHLALVKSPEDLRERAIQFTSTVGSGSRRLDSAIGFGNAIEAMQYSLRVLTQRSSANLSPIVVSFWYRQSPQLMTSRFLYGAVSVDDPPLTSPGMVLVSLDAVGRVTRYQEVPPAEISDHAPTQGVDWAQLLQEAGYADVKWTQVTALSTPFTFADSQAAYSGTVTDIPWGETRIEMATLRGKLVELRVTYPWSADKTPPLQTTDKLFLYFLAFVSSLTIFWTLWLCRRNLQKGRGDRRGAFRLALFAFAIELVISALQGHFVSDLDEMIPFVITLSFALLVAATVCVLYLALEPQARRKWPSSMVSWTRVIDLKLTDSLVARDILIGCAVGALGSSLDVLRYGIRDRLHETHFIPPPVDLFPGLPQALAHALSLLCLAVILILGLFVLIAFLRALFRRSFIAYAIIAVFILLSDIDLHTEHWVVRLALAFISSALIPAVLIRFGLIAAIAAYYIPDLIQDFPITHDPSAWFFRAGLVGLLIPIILALYGFYFSRAGGPMFGSEALDER